MIFCVLLVAIILREAAVVQQGKPGRGDLERTTTFIHIVSLGSPIRRALYFFKFNLPELCISVSKR